MAITIKKSPLTIKRSDAALATEAPSAPHMTSGPVLSRVTEPGPAWTFYAVSGLIAMFLMIGVIGLQYLEYTYYEDAFPVRIPQAAAVAPAKTAEKVEPAASNLAEKAETAVSKPAVAAPTEKAPAEKAAEPAATASPPATSPAPVPAAVAAP